MTKKGNSFGYKSSHIHRGRVSIGDFLFRGSVYILRDAVRLLCIFLFFLLHLPHLYRSCDQLTLYLSLVIYIYVCVCVCVDVCYLPIFTCVVFFFFSLYAHDSYYLYAIFYFCFTLKCLDEFCLKSFRNTSCQSLFAMNSLLANFFKSLC